MGHRCLFRRTGGCYESQFFRACDRRNGECEAEAHDEATVEGA
jgi:hypothetical protein